jgi:hypothetical protein
MRTVIAPHAIVGVRAAAQPCARRRTPTQHPDGVEDV